MSKKIIVKTVLLILSVTMLTGCWDLYDIQDVNYVVAVGLDYDKERDIFISYAQMLDFTFVAKNEQPPGTEPIVYIGSGEGKTINMALTNLYKTAQMKTMWSHVTSIVFSERLLENGIDEVIDGYIRYPESRLSQWVFATSEPIDDLFATPAFFNLSTLLTLLHKPNEILEQRTYLQAKRLKDVLIQLKEPGKDVSIPSITINHTQWNQNKKSIDKMEYDGMYFLKDSEYKGFLSLEDFNGIHWGTKDNERYPLFLEKDNEKLGVLVFGPSDVEIELINQNGIPRYNMDIKIKADLYELMSDSTQTELEDISEDIIIKQVRETYKKANEKEIDIYGLEYYTYVHHFQLWKELIKNDFKLEEDSLGDIHVNVTIVHSGLLKYDQSAEEASKEKNRFEN